MLGSGFQEGDVALHAQAFLEVTSWDVDSGMDHCCPFGYEDSRPLWREESWQTCLPPAPPCPFSLDPLSLKGDAVLRMSLYLALCPFSLYIYTTYFSSVENLSSDTFT